MKYCSALFVYLFLQVGALFAQNSDPQWIFNNDNEYCRQVYEDFKNRPNVPNNVQQQLLKMAASSNAQDVRNYHALYFLYAYMPQSDMVDYDINFFTQQVDIAYEALNTFSWGKNIPAEIFRHFVLVYRVNNENLDSARSFIFHQLKERIQDKSMYEAALEVNHWCHEYVDYQPSDARTSAPLATLKTSHGRCGEESTLTVAALRAVGIPARQCYTPRWAHCDDNHAWVEVWVDGQWYFLGACEPEPELNMGWFAVPSSRTMMVHTNVFGKYNGPEEVNKQTPYYSCINVLANYAETTLLTITVVDENQRPVQDALVRFKLYNYAEYYTLASRLTNESGEASILTGKGDLLVWVSKDRQFQYAKIDGRTTQQLTIQLTGDNPTDQVVLLDMYPPSGGTSLTTTSPERQLDNDRRKQEEDAQREVYRASWPTKESLAKDQIHNDNFSDEELFDIIHRSEGNYKEIIAFLNNHKTKDEHYLIAEYVAALADKDLRDAPFIVLEEQLSYFQSNRWPKEVFVKGILPARISNELLRSDRTSLKNRLQNSFPNMPSVSQLTQFVRSNIVVDEQCNYFNCPISPIGVLEGGRADAHSRNIFFVALCRAFGVPAYMDNASGELYAWENNQWDHVTLTDHDSPTPNESLATIILHNPQHYTYYIHYTLQRFENGEYVSYDFENDDRVESDPIILSVPAGQYCLSTGNRYSNGDVLSQLDFFTVNANESVEKSITLRPLIARAQNFGHIDVDQTMINGQSLQTRMSQADAPKMILCLITPGTEPVNHLVKEMEAQQKSYESSNVPVLFIANNNHWKSGKKFPKNVEVTTDQFDQTLQKILDGLTEKKEGLNPVCIVVDRNGTILFFSEGYHIGLGELLLKE